LVQIGITWEEASFNGGSEVIDYRIWYTTQEADSFEVLDAAITLEAFTAVSLTTGTTYKFKVQSRNVFDYSELSEEVIILAASKPSKPDAPVTTWSNDYDTVTVTWTEPEINGAAILTYTIQIR
jgi:hypothetical protein